MESVALLGSCRRVAILSPHRDDAAFSCGSLLVSLAEADVAVTVINVFTRSDYAPYAIPRDVGAISALRRAEDEALVAWLGGRGRAPTLLDLALLDAPLRLASDSMGVATADLVARETDRLVLALPGWDYDLVIAPAGVGDHVDHVIVREALRRVVPRDVLGFYEDQPYAARAPETFSSNASHDGRASVKSALARLYPSQVAPEIAEEIAGFASRHGERYWLPRPLLPHAARQDARP